MATWKLRTNAKCLQTSGRDGRDELITKNKISERIKNNISSLKSKRKTTKTTIKANRWLFFGARNVVLAAAIGLNISIPRVSNVQCSMRSLFHWNSVNFTRNTVIHNILWIWELYFWSKIVWNSNARRPTHFDVYGFGCMNHCAPSVVVIFQLHNMRAIPMKPLISRMTKTISQHYGNIDSSLQFSELNSIHLIRRIVT